MVTAPDEVLQAERLALGGVAPAAAPGAPKGALTIPAGATFAEIEKKVLGDVLRRHEGNRSLTAAELGLSRRTIQRKIQEYDLPY